MEEKDLVIIGGGPGGYVPAIKAAQKGIKVTLIEEDELGGTCLNRGCIPTKALLKSAHMFESLNKTKNFGISVENPKFEISEAVKWKERVVKRLTAGVKSLLAKNNVEVINGRAVFTANNKLEVNGSQLVFKNAIIAAGSVPIKLPIPGIDKPHVVYSKEALNLTELPQKLVIIGGGVIGVEFADIFGSAGSEVTIIEMMPRILPVMDEEISTTLEKVLKSKGIQILTQTKVVEIKDNSVVVEQGDSRKEIECEKLLVAVGRKPNLENLGLDKTDIHFDKKGIKVNEYMETNVSGIYAVGDVIPTPQLAHVATDEGLTAVKNILGDRQKMKYNAVPYCVYTNPEAASAGKTEDELKKEGVGYKVGRFPLMANGKAMVDGVREGFVKVLAGEKYEEVLGIHIIAPNASEMIHQACTAITLEATLDELIETIYPHPTIGEAVLEAALGAKDKPLHL